MDYARGDEMEWEGQRMKGRERAGKGEEMARWDEDQ